MHEGDGETGGAALEVPCVSASNVLATTCQYEALRYVSFPVQTLGKCAKMIPVMLWGYFINQKRYTLIECAIAACVTFGCMILDSTEI